MKKLFVLILLSFYVISNLNAQNHRDNKGKFSLSVQAGVSLMPALYYRNATKPDMVDKVPPAFLFDADYYIIDAVSVGLSFAYQQASFIDEGYWYQVIGGIKKEDVSIKLTRMNFAYRILFHYVNKEHVALYSGVRIGMNIHNVSDNSTDPNYVAEYGSFREVGFAPRLIGLGIKLFIVEDLSIVTEIGIGYPSFMTFGLSYRL